MNHYNEIWVDNFAGGGGASVGIENGGERIVDIAINHDAEAIEMHKANHPETKHYINDVWSIDPEEITEGRSVGLAWFSPDCKHFSKAKGGKPVEKGIRDLAWIVVKWAAKKRPRVIMLENVEEFQDWGPLDENSKPDKARKGLTFQSWKNQLEDLGYKVEHNILRASDFGAGTIRKRLFVIARCDGQKIVWPKPTHGEGLKPFVTAADCIDWSIPAKSVIGRDRMLADNTLKRIAKGLDKYVLNHPKPYTREIGGGVIDNPFTTRICQTGRADPSRGIDEPISTIVSKNEHLLLSSYLVKLRKNCIGQSVSDPLDTITSGGNHFAVMSACLIKYYGTAVGQSVNEPIHTITAKDRFMIIEYEAIKESLTEEQRYNAWWVARLLEDFGDKVPEKVYPSPRASLVMLGDYVLFDILMRMFEPKELYRCQGFPDSYEIKPIFNGKPLTKTSQVRMCGNSVPPPLSKALVDANLDRGEFQFKMNLEA